MNQRQGYRANCSFHSRGHEPSRPTWYRTHTIATMCTTADELLDAAIGRLIREHVLLETMLRALRWQLHLNAGGSPEDTALVPSHDFSRLLRECRTEANRIIDDVDLLDQLNEALDRASQINEGRNRFYHDLLLPAMGGRPGWNRSRW